MGRIGTSIAISLASFVLGCGSVKDSGGAIDGSIDTPPGVDADLSGNATVVTEAALFGGTVGANVGNIDVISMLPNNTVLEMKQTDAGGNATIKVYPGGTVTAVYKHTIDMGADLITYVGVKPGDTLTFGSRNFSTSGQTNTTIGSQTYSWPAFAGATFYEVDTTCTGVGASPPAVSVAGSEFNLCHKEPMDVIFTVFNNSGVAGFGFRSNVAFTNGANVAIGGWSNAVNATINMTGIPPEFTSVNGQFNLVMDSTREIAFSSYSGTPTGGAFTQQFLHAQAGERIVGRANLFRPGFQTATIMDSFATGTLTQTVAAPMLPALLQGSAIASSALRMANWFTISDASSSTDGVVARVSWNHVVSAMSNQHQWYFIMPPGTNAVVFPKLPAQFNDNLPFPQDGVGVQVRTFDISTVANYDAVRMTPSRNIMCIDCAMRAGDFSRAVTTGNVQ